VWSPYYNRFIAAGIAVSSRLNNVVTAYSNSVGSSWTAATVQPLISAGRPPWGNIVDLKCNGQYTILVGNSPATAFTPYYSPTSNPNIHDREYNNVLTAGTTNPFTGINLNEKVILRYTTRDGLVKKAYTGNLINDNTFGTYWLLYRYGEPGTYGTEHYYIEADINPSSSTSANVTCTLELYNSQWYSISSDGGATWTVPDSLINSSDQHWLAMNVKSVIPYYGNKWCGLTVTPNFISANGVDITTTNGWGANTTMDVAGASTRAEVYLYATITSRIQQGVYYTITYTVNGKTNVNLFGTSSTVYLSTTPYLNGTVGNYSLTIQAARNGSVTFSLPSPPAQVTNALYLIPQRPGVSSATSVAFNGVNWVGLLGQDAKTVVVGPTLRDLMSWQVTGTSAIQTYTITTMTTPTNIIWTGNRFFIYGSGTDTLLVSSDGTTWNSVSTNMSLSICDMSFTPNVITLNSGMEYQKYFLSAKTLFSGTVGSTITNNDFISIKNVSFDEIQAFVNLNGFPNTTLRLVPASNDNGGSSDGAIVYYTSNNLYVK